MGKIDSLPRIAFSLILLSISVIVIVLQPSIFPVFDLANERAANIGTTIGGVVGPIVSLYSAYLLYEALTAQQLSIREQRHKSDSDIIVLLLNQLQEDYERFLVITRRNTPTKEEVVTQEVGYKALIRFANMYSVGDPKTTFEDFLMDSRSDDLLILMRSLALLEEHMKLSNFEPKLEKLFKFRFELFYKTKMEYPMSVLANKFKTVDEPIVSVPKNQTV